ncbi:hypothetical protein BJV74DRAFT_769949 [Russula compacta]|nr:hypothetical protein BJV74DRAFT_769949 [Russula compacta]
MRPSLRTAHRPLISFIGKRQWPPGPQHQHPHPAAPAQLKEAFSGFLEKYRGHFSPLPSKSTQHSSRGPIFNDFWEAPEHFTQPKIRQLEDSEIDAVLVSLMSFSMRV